MKVVYLTGLNGHTLAMADALYKRLGNDFIFIDDDKERVQYGSVNNSFSKDKIYDNRTYVLHLRESDATLVKAKQLIADADVLMVGGEPFELVKERIKDNKLTFRLGERSMKGPFWKDIIRYFKLTFHYNRYSRPNYRKLSLSGFDANDMRLCNKSYRDKCYQFAYFNQIPSVDIDRLMCGKPSDCLNITWCSRFIGWKHPELPVLLAKRLVESGRKNFVIQMIGSSATPLWHKIKNKVEKLDLTRNIILTGGIPNNEVVERMQKSNVFIFTSDRGEGWGVVLNEAMSCGCACVASHEIGAVPTLIKNGENGLVFKSRSVDSLFEKVAQLYDNKQLCMQYGRNAYKTITEDWSVQQAIDRFLELSQSIIDGIEIHFEKGPCSKSRPVDMQSLINS